MNILAIRISTLVFAAALAGWFGSTASAQVATGGGYTLNKAVIANGGGQSTDPVNNQYRVNGTAGQPAAGYGLTSPRFGVNGGFWNLVQAPTAANASIIGRVLAPNGAGVRNVSVVIEGGSLTTPQQTLTTSFGYFTFDGLEPGEVYVISVGSKRFGFANPTQTIMLTGNIIDLVFQAGWQN